jgi:hypothetical protein
MATHHRSYLVISPIGDESMHGSWLADRPNRTFDVLLIHYGRVRNFGRSDADHYLARRGFKWELIDIAAQELRQVIEQYDYLWCPDCDIRATTAQVNRLFEICAQHQLHLAQPAIAAGEVTYQFLRPRPDVLLRYTPFVEVMCPVFSREGFWRVKSTFLETRSGWGLDLLWPRLFDNKQRAIIDAVGVEHTGRLFTGENYKNLNSIGVDPRQEMQQVIARHGGFNRRLHRKLVRGRIKLPAVWEHAPPPRIADHWLARLGFDRKCA